MGAGGACADKRLQIFFYVFGSLIIIGFVLFGVLYELGADKQLEEMAYVCDKGSLFYDSWSNSKKSGAQFRRNFYFYNIDNATQVLNGGSMQLTEIGPFSYEFSSKKFDVDFQSGGSVEYREYQRLSFSEKHSCDGCQETDPMTTVNIAWQAVLMQLQPMQSEGLLGLAAICTPAQIANMNTGKAPCSDAERGGPTDCKCCTAPNCAALIDPKVSQGTAIISYMAKFDSSGVVSDESMPNPNFPLLDSIYSPVFVTSSPRGIIGGRPSAFLGFIQARASLTNSDTDTLATLASFTRDYYDACKSHCPDLATFQAQLAALPNANAKMALLRDTECSGHITAADTTKDYLVDMQCKQATPTFLAQVLTPDPDHYTCMDGGAQPCCLKSTQMTMLGGANIPGWGCVRELPGYILTRKTDNEDEYAETNTWEFAQKTGCKGSGKSHALDMTKFQSKETFTVWSTPDSYVFPNMPYADTIYPAGTAADVTNFDVDITGKDVGIRDPKGFSSTEFFEYQGTDGKLPGATVDIFSRTLNQPIEFTYNRSTTIKGINVAKFTMNYETLTAQNEENQKKGFGVPYAGVYAGLQYARSVPAFISYPHFYQCDSAARAQNSNAVAGSASTSGIELFSRVSAYADGAPLLDEPVPIDEAYTEAHKDLYDISLYLDPWSGKSLSSTVVLMVSTTIWRCHPSVNPSCALFMKAGNDLCFTNAVAAGTTLPCSASNVFSPKLLGAKIIPNFFVTENSKVDDETADTFHETFETRQASHIMLVVGIVIGVFMIVATYWFGTRNQHKPMERIGSKPENGVSLQDKQPVPGQVDLEGNDAL